MKEKIYIASKTKHAAKWLKLRSLGVPIISTWIDEAGEGQSSDLSDLAARCIEEVRSADRVVLYLEDGDTLKGQLIEVGAALACGVPVYSFGFDQRSAFRRHPLWIECINLESAFNFEGADYVLAK